MECKKCDLHLEPGSERYTVELCPLHAVASELLVAAKEALDVLDSLEYYDEAREMLRKAIAKVKGGNHE